MLRKSRYLTRGFTLVELLVVITIICILASLLLPALFSVFDSGRKKTCQVEIQQLEAAISIYEEVYRDFPPSSLKNIGLLQNNQINEGIETLVLCLSSTHNNASYFEFKDQQLQNTDLDVSPVSLNKLTGSIFKNDDLFEIIDPWGNPYIYFHNSQLLDTTNVSYMIHGEEKKITPYMKRSKTGNIAGYSKYQIISCSSNGIQDEDDVMNQ